MPFSIVATRASSLKVRALLIVAALKTWANDMPAACIRRSSRLPFNPGRLPKVGDDGVSVARTILAFLLAR